MASPQQNQANTVGAGLSAIGNFLSNAANTLSPTNLFNQGYPQIGPSNISGILNPTVGVGLGAAQNTGGGFPQVPSPPASAGGLGAWSPVLQTIQQLSPATAFGQAVNWATTPTVTNGPGYTGPNDPDPAHKTTAPSPIQQAGNAIANVNNAVYNAVQPRVQNIAAGIGQSANNATSGGGGGGSTNTGFGVANGGTAQPGTTAVNAGQQGAYANYTSPYANQAALTASGTPSWLSQGQTTMASPLQSQTGFGAQVAQPGFAQTSSPFAPAPAGQTGAFPMSPVPANPNGAGTFGAAPQTAGAFPMVPPAPSTGMGNSALGALATAGIPANQPQVPAQSYEAQFIAAMIGGQQVTDQNGNVIADFSMVPANVRQSILSSIMQGAGPTAVPGVGVTPQSTGGFGNAPQPAPRYNPQNNPNSVGVLAQAAQLPAGGLPSTLSSGTASNAMTTAQQQQYLANKYPQIAGNPQALAAFSATPVQGNNQFDYVPGFGVIPYQDILSSKGNPLQGQYLLSHLDKLVRSGALQSAQQAGAPSGFVPAPSVAPSTLAPTGVPSMQQLQQLMPPGANLSPTG